MENNPGNNLCGCATDGILRTLWEQMEEITEEICGEYCRFGYEFNHREHVTDEETDEFYATRCEKCPLMRI